jgi:ribosomal protein S18 acetylase RimI-like enzyme
VNKILKLSELSLDQKTIVLEAVEEIFFLSSSIKEFSTPERKRAFYKRWCEDYQTLYPENFLVIMSEDRILGYLSGCLDTLKSLEVLSVPGLNVFQDLYNDFPAHFHINFHPDARGKGLGSVLVRHFIDSLLLKEVVGVHLITSPDAQNVNFYERLGFNQTHTRDFNNMPLHFMGRLLDQ